jgi:HD superfamily phosphodiesterase
MDYKSWIPILKEEVAVEYEKAPKELHSSVHQMDHLDRVWSRAEVLGRKLRADMEVLVAAVYLHDIGRQYGLEVHGPKSAEHAEQVLERIDFPKEKQKAVLHAIEAHDYQTGSAERDSLEAKILYDADKLDVFGDIGIRRVTQWNLVEKRTNKTIPEILGTINRRYETLVFQESKDLGREDYLKIKKHFENLL